MIKTQINQKLFHVFTERCSYIYDVIGEEQEGGGKLYYKISA
jgi:hypothetical protein